MKKTILLLTVILLAFAVNAQTTEDNTGWNNSGIIGINLSQTSFTNWSQGGENSLAYSLFGNFAFNYMEKDWMFTNKLKLTYGKTKLASQEARINENEFYLEDVYSYLAGWKLNPYISNIVQTVIAPGYDYGIEPAVQQSAFFDPGYISQSAGFEYIKEKIFKSRLGLAIQETFTNKFNKFSDDPATSEIEKSKIETGIESVTELKIPVVKNVVYQSYLRLFGRFNKIGVWDVRWDNLITMKVNDFLNVNLNVLMVYKKIETPKTQLREALMVGVSYTLF